MAEQRQVEIRNTEISMKPIVAPIVDVIQELHLKI